MTLKLLSVNATKTTNELDGNNLICFVRTGLANEGKRARFLVGLANTQLAILFKVAGDRFSS